MVDLPHNLSALRALKLAREALTDMAWELEELELRLHTLAEQAAEGGHDLLLNRELAALRRQRAEQEERVLQQMLRVDELAAAVAHDQEAQP